MGKASWTVPVAVLGAIVGVGLIFIWWWFPRTWQKGQNADIRDFEGGGVGDDDQRAAQRAAQREHAHMIVQRALAEEQMRKRGEVVPPRAPELDANGVPIRPAGYTAF